MDRICCVLLLAAWPATAVAGSYVVLNRSAKNSLVRVSSDGNLISTIAVKAGGYGLAKDTAGNYIIAAVSSLLRVTPSGSVSTIATAPRGSQWMRVVQDPEGVFLAVDNQQHAIWRISADGQSVAKLANYAEASPIMEDVSIVLDESGNYLVIEELLGTHLWRVTPGGEVTPVPLRGINIATGGVIIDESDGNYLIGSYRDNAVFRLSRAGDVTKFAELKLDKTALTGMARNPETGEIVATLNFAQSLIRISADGRTVSRLAKDPSYLSFPTAILFESGK
jgi:hypothetical protein